MSNRHFLPLPFFICILGVAFSLWNLFGNSEVLCVTEGCALFQNFSVAGVSMWWAGVVGMGVLLVLSTFGLLGLGSFVAACGVLLDLALLIVMLGSAPCLNCLIIGLLLALVYYSLRHSHLVSINPRAHVSRLNWLLGLWGIFFILNAGVLVADTLKPWPLQVSRNAAYLAEQAPVQVYFSPSCSACVILVRGMAADQQSVENIAWYPIAENERDILVIAQLDENLSQGQSLVSALNNALTGVYPEESVGLLRPSLLSLQIRLWRNQAHVLRAGSDRLPFVEYRGIPGELPAAALARSGAIAPPSAPALPSTVGGFCEGDVPCDPVTPSEPGDEGQTTDSGSLLQLMGGDQPAAQQ